MKSNYLEYGGKLALICLACMLGVGGAYVKAMESIRKGKEAAETGAILAVLTADEDETAPTKDDLEEIDGVFLYKAGDEKRYAAQGQHQGFSGDVVVAVGARVVDGELQILRVRVITQTETPGLGTRIAEQSSSLTLWTKLGSMMGSEVVETKPWPFLDQFHLSTPKGIENMMLTGDAGERDTRIVKITGVTISSNAATLAVKKALLSIKEKLP